MKQTRRDFIKKTGCALSMVGLATQVEHFGLMSALAQSADEKETSGTDGNAYRALVCVFLSGGSDANNMIIPVHNSSSVSNYTAYSNARTPQGLAFTQAQLQNTNINVPRMGNLAYALHPAFGDQTGTTPPGGNPNRGLHELWAQGKLAAVTNLGNLVRPMTRDQYRNNLVQKPFQLFSHSDQVAQQQTSRSDRKVFVGWGGVTSDKMTGTSNPTGLIPMITTISGSQLFTSGQTTSPLAVAAGNVPLNQTLVLNNMTATDAVTTARRNSFNNLRGFDRTNNVVKASQDVTSQAISASQALSTFQEVTALFPTTSIGNQLKQVARLIKKRTELNVTRQIFYVQIGGFDTHQGQVATPTTGQNGLFLQLSQALRAFYDEMVVQGVADSVTAFTLSDFNRTFNPAGTGANVGSDHAWGGHALVLGGDVRGGDFYGINTSNGTPFPSLVFSGPDDTDNGSTARGRWIPTTSTDQYAATLAKWYGLPTGELSNVFPNIGNFTTSDLGFMMP
jgi:uncharacterized protein (DUF1501 family)